MTLIYMFPGQSSRYPGMLHKLGKLHAPNRALLAAASDMLHRDLGKHYTIENADVFGRNRDIQIGVFLANHMFLQILESHGIQAKQSMGLSLGEWNHLVHIGAVDFWDALLAVEQRGEAYDNGPRGCMASISPISAEELQEVCHRVKEVGVLEITNFNSPSQQVLSGETAAVERALEILEEDYYVQAVVIERQVPMHCSIFEPAGQRFKAHLESMTFQKPGLPYLPNRLARIEENPQKETFVELLSSHVYRQVFWRQSIDYVIEHVDTPIFIEVGPLAVLFNMLNKKWGKWTKFKMDTAEDTKSHQEKIISELKAFIG